MNDLHSIMTRYQDGMLSAGEALQQLEGLAISIADARLYVINSLINTETVEAERRFKAAGVIK